MARSRSVAVKTLLVLCITTLELTTCGALKNLRAQNNVFQSFLRARGARAHFARPLVPPALYARLAAQAKASSDGEQSPKPCCLPNQFQYDSDLHTVETGGNATAYYASVYFDGLSSKLTLNVLSLDSSGHIGHRVDIYLKNGTDTMWYFIMPDDKYCRKSKVPPNMAADIFNPCQLEPNSTFVGSAYIGGGKQTAPVQTWLYVEPNYLRHLVLTPEVCAPVTSFTANGIGGTIRYTSDYSFNFQTTILDPSVFDLPPYCPQEVSTEEVMPVRGPRSFFAHL